MRCLEMFLDTEKCPGNFLICLGKIQVISRNLSVKIRGNVLEMYREFLVYPAFVWVFLSCSYTQSLILVTLMLVNFFILGYLGVQPPTFWGTLIAQVGTVYYFLFFILMPFWTPMGRFGSVPARVNFQPH